MNIDLRKTSHILFFVVFLSVLSFSVGWLTSLMLPGAPFWVETLSPLAAYGLLYAFFDKVAWHWPVFRWLGIVTVPDMRGRWRGEQTSSYRNKDGKNRRSRVILEIRQTFSEIQANTYYHQWQSGHIVCACVNIDGTLTLVMMYESEPKVSYDGDASAHKGVVKLVKLPDGKLSGTYFNARGNHGELTFQRTMLTLHHTFESVKTKK